MYDVPPFCWRRQKGYGFLRSIPYINLPVRDVYRQFTYFQAGGLFALGVIPFELDDTGHRSPLLVARAINNDIFELTLSTINNYY